MQHQDVGLLQHLRAKGALVSEQQVRGDGAMNEFGDYKWFQPIEARELLVHLCLRVVAVNERTCELEPHLSFRVRDETDRNLGRAAEIPTRHDIREGVVVHGLVVLVRPDDAVDVRVARRSSRMRETQYRAVSVKRSSSGPVANSVSPLQST